MDQLVIIVGFLSASIAVLVWPGKLLAHSLRHMVHDTVTEAMEPYLTNGERTVANYAHEAADAARAASEAAKEARDAAYEAKNASLETRQIVMTLRGGQNG